MLGRGADAASIEAPIDVAEYDGHGFEAFETRATEMPRYRLVATMNDPPPPGYRVGAGNGSHLLFCRL